MKSLLDLFVLLLLQARTRAHLHLCSFAHLAPLPTRGDDSEDDDRGACDEELGVLSKASRALAFLCCGLMSIDLLKKDEKSKKEQRAVMHFEHNRENNYLFAFVLLLQTISPLKGSFL